MLFARTKMPALNPSSLIVVADVCKLKTHTCLRCVVLVMDLLLGCGFQRKHGCCEVFSK